MRKTELTSIATERLKVLYPDAICSLNYSDAFQLLIATRLSAQCKDSTVNMVTPSLFAEFPDAKSMAKATPEEIEKHIRICGLYRTKARDLVGIAQMIINDFGGNIPCDIDTLTLLPGVGRKTANLVCGDIYGQPAVVCDTHFIRLCNRLGLVNTTDPKKVEDIMRKLLDPDESNDFCHRSVLFGRDICTAKIAHCEKCPLNDLCPKKGVK